MSSLYVPVESLLQSRAFRRLLAISLAGHVAVFLALVLRPSRRGELISSSPVMVQMVQMPKTAAPPAPAAKPAPPKPAPKPPAAAPPPPPPKPVVKEIVIPKEPAPLSKPKPPPTPVEKKPETPPPSAADLIQKMTERVEAEEAAKAPQGPATEAPATAEASPGTFDPLLSPWVANVKTRVRANWSGASVCQGEPQFDVDIDAAGHLTHIVLAQSSGDKYCDDTAERALRKSDPLPPPPRPMSFTLNLNPKDLQ